MRVTRWGEFGILCSMQLAKQAATNGKAQPLGAIDIAKHQDIPIKYTQQILHRLRRGGILQSIRGPKGGFILARPAEQITLKDIMHASEGETFEVMCETHPLGKEYCIPKEQCALSAVWTQLKAAVDGVLGGKTLASLVADQGDMKPTPQGLVAIQPGAVANSPTGA